jgi:hypothetical protein
VIQGSDPIEDALLNTLPNLGEDDRRRGVFSDGLRTMVQLAASAGATLQAIWFSGQFHG